jgi:hypothetical protein
MGRHKLKKQYNKKLIAAVSAGLVLLLLSFYFIFNGFNLPFFFPGQKDDPKQTEIVETTPESLQEPSVTDTTSDLEKEKQAESKEQISPETTAPEIAPEEVVPGSVSPVTPNQSIPMPQPVLPQQELPLLPQVIPITPQIPAPLPLLPIVPEVVPDLKVKIENTVLPPITIDSEKIVKDTIVSTCTINLVKQVIC